MGKSRHYNDFYGFTCDDHRWVDPSRRRTREEHPYSYDEFFIFGSRAAIAPRKVHGVYSDRLHQWDSTKFSEATRPVKKRFAQYSRQECSQFLSIYYGRPIDCVALAEGCNASNGFPYWVFWFLDPATPIQPIGEK